MTPEERQMLEEAVVLARENHQILKRMQRARRWGQFFVFVKWLAIAGLAAGIYYYLQPIFVNLMQIYGQASGSIKDASANLQSLSSLLEQLSSFKLPR